ncbi:DUF2868 domain-containing protein [Massilia endophytica]|uniref:DUF2868 domain-containing protein n=1 Tax=Massilia endophytica TaxID=2899220 RepID=UPI001E347D19|nr:DUF2868 domain-containing protein [Massilia endophytica]UGQ47732.1 DUF2868 domain-containing protein [Massilia endophytica]
MNEQAARDIVLVRAIETSDRNFEILSQDDRHYANRTARELAQWQASETGKAAAPVHFYQQRAEQIIRKLSQRHPAFSAFVKRRTGLHGLSWLLPLLALVLGAGLDRIADPHRVDLLSGPLLLIIGWNLLVYIIMLVWLCIPRAGTTSFRARWIRRLAGGKAAMPRKMPHALSSALFAYMADWTQLSARLYAARLGAVVHLSAAMFALGAGLSLYARGLMTQYAAGWESTFLDAAQVHELLSLLFWPATQLLQLPGFTLQEVQSLHYAAAPNGAGGARWVHLYAATLALLVILPRLVLAGLAAARAGWLARHFPLDLEQPYFRQLHDAAGGEPGVLRVLPYSFTVDEARAKGLAAIAAGLLGERARVQLLPSLAYGAELPQIGQEGATLTAGLFNLAATPEKENHGAFITQLLLATGGNAVLLIDESAFAERAPDPQRLRQRVELWREFCIFHGKEPQLVNLLA